MADDKADADGEHPAARASGESPGLEVGRGGSLPASAPMQGGAQTLLRTLRAASLFFSFIKRSPLTSLDLDSVA